MTLFETAIGPHVLHSYQIEEGYKVEVIETRHPADPDRVAYQLLATRVCDKPPPPYAKIATAGGPWTGNFYYTTETLEEAGLLARSYVEFAKWWLESANRRGDIAYAEANIIEGIATFRAEVERLKARLDGEQHFIDAVCHYRNLAIVLGAKPEQMLGKFDRELCEGGIDPNETSGGYHISVNQELDVLKDVWAENERLKAENGALQGCDDRWVKVAEQYERELGGYRKRIGDLLDQLAREEADAHQFQKERDVARARLSNLLARIHRDGGHYEAQHGTSKAVVDADVAVAQAFTERDEARAEVERLRDIVAVNDQRLADVWDTAKRVLNGDKP